MPTWLLIAIWVLWAWYTFIMCVALHRIADKKLGHTERGSRFVRYWTIFTVLWICWNIFG